MAKRGVIMLKRQRLLYFFGEGSNNRLRCNELGVKIFDVEGLEACVSGVTPLDGAVLDVESWDSGVKPLDAAVLDAEGWDSGDIERNKLDM